MAALNDAQIAGIYRTVYGNDPGQNQINTLMSSGYADSASQFQDYLTGRKEQQDAPGKALSAYQAAIGTAVSGLQTAGTNLDTQYGDLLSKVLGQGTVAMNTATTGENNLLASRGITNNSPLYSSQMTSAQLPVTAQNQSAVSNLGYTQAGLKLNLANQIAGLQQTGAEVSAGLPLQYGSLQLAQAANLANVQLAQAQTNQTNLQAPYISSPYGPYNVSTLKFAGGNSGAGQLVYQNGKWYISS